MQLTLQLLAACPCMVPSQQLFADPFEVPLGIGGATTITKVDLNADGLEDLVFTTEAETVISVSMGEVGGTFTAPRTQGVLIGSWTDDFDSLNRRVEKGDFNGDGNADLVISGRNLATNTTDLWLMLGNGDGTLQSATNVALLGPGSTQRWVDLDVADMNGDGYLDVLVAVDRFSLGYVAGSPSGLVGPTIPLMPGESASMVVPDDFNGDGRTDILARISDDSWPAEFTSIFYADASGAFDIFNATPIGFNPRTAEIADLDLDGDLDLLLMDERAIRVRLVEALGSNTYAAPIVYQTDPAPGPLEWGEVELADLESDGLLDLVIRTTSRRTSVIRNQGSFQFSQQQPAGGPRASLGVTLDLNGDGLLDAAKVTGRGFFSPSSPETFVGTISPSGAFEFVVQDSVGEVFDQSRSQFLDVNRDGLDDFLATDQVSGDIIYKLSLGTAGLGPSVPIMPSKPSRVRLSDINGDGFEDILAVTAGNTVSAALGTGSGFLPSSVYVTTPFTIGVLWCVDLNVDGFGDLLFWDSSQSELKFQMGSPSGLGPLTTVYSSSVYIARDLELNDLNGDGIPDPLFSYLSRAFVLFSVPGGGYAPPQWVASSTEVEAKIVTADVDFDGAIDLIIPNRLNISWARNLGSGTFGPEQQIAVTRRAADVTVSDVDLDGDLDIAWYAELLTGVPVGYLWVENLAGGAFGPKRSLPVNPPVGSGLTLRDFADVDGDGDRDAVYSRGGHLYYGMNETLISLGDSVCPNVVPNSTGQAGELIASGTTDLALNQLRLLAARLPAGSAGYFLCSQQAMVGQSVPGSVGTLCLGGSIGRYSRPDQIRVSDAAGTFRLDLDVTMVPTPSAGLVPIVPGDTWVFQAWHRDVGSTGSTSNFTDAKLIQF